VKAGLLREIVPAQDIADPARLALTDLCQTLFSMNEFIYID